MCAYTFCCVYLTEINQSISKVNNSCVWVANIGEHVYMYRPIGRKSLRERFSVSHMQLAGTNTRAGSTARIDR